MTRTWTKVVGLCRCVAVPAALVAGLGGAAAARAADKQPTTDTAPATTSQLRTMSGTIQHIDADSRVVTVKSDDGATTEVQAPADMQRFNELKVGDRVDIKYYESVMLSVVQPGQPTPPSGTSVQRMPGGGVAPGGTTFRQMKATVTIMMVDPDKNQVTFRGPDGKTRTTDVSDPTMRKKIAQLKPGDRVQVVFTQSIAASIVPK